MFGKLLSRLTEKKSDHPLGSDENLDALIGDIPEADPARLLLDVDHWLAGMEGHVADIGPLPGLHALLRLDQFAAPAVSALLARYLDSSGRDYLADSAWSALDEHAGHVFRGHVAALNGLVSLAESEAERTRMARCGARALRAWALRKKLLRFRYRTPAPALWQEAHDVLRVLARASLLQTAVVAYRDEAETSSLAEYLAGVYLELTPLGNLTPPQLDFIDGFLRGAGGLELASRPHEGTTHCVDITTASGPVRLTGKETPGPGLRYCSVTRLRPAVMRLAAAIGKGGKDGEGVPDWVALAPATRGQIEDALMTLALHWAPKPPSRGSDRISQENELKVVFGFDLARRMIAFSRFAASGRSLHYEGDDINRLFEESRFGRIETEAKSAPPAEDAAPVVVNPLDTLQKLELAGDRAQMESWRQVDGSGTGIGVVVPAILPRHRIGALVCLRYADGLEWRMGVIRRIGRDGANRPSIGLETLAWPSLSALAKPVGDGSAWTSVLDAGHGWYDAILPGYEDNEIVLPGGSFAAGLEVDVRSEAGLWHLRLDTLIDRGSDYDRVEFTKLS